MDADKRSAAKNTVTVTVDRAIGTCHPEYPDMRYPINYGFIKGIMAPDGEEQDAYIIGINIPVKQFTGRVIAVVHRYDDKEEKGWSRQKTRPFPWTTLKKRYISRNNISTLKS